jgi:RNA polymerase sigma-70 factor (ECF subfamily)
MHVEIDFKEVYEEFQPKILHYLYRLTGHDEVEDIAQEVFEKVSRSLEGFKGESKLSTWLYRIATNTALDRLRTPSFNRSPERSVPEESAGVQDRNVWTGQTKTSTDQELIRKEMGKCVREYIDKLPPDHRAVMVLSELEGFKNREIADILQVSLDTVKIRLHRARASLKKELDGGCSFYRNEQDIFACDRKPLSIKSRKSD